MQKFIDNIALKFINAHIGTLWVWTVLFSTLSALTVGVLILYIPFTFLAWMYWISSFWKIVWIGIQNEMDTRLWFLKNIKVTEIEVEKNSINHK